MHSLTTDDAIEEFARSYFREHGIRPASVRIRRFPGECIVIVEVTSQLQKAIALGNDIDEKIPDGFVTVKQTETSSKPTTDAVRSVRDERVTRLIELLDERSRTSRAQPSLRYVEDIEGRLQVATSERHHLIFGRRGVGKTALLLEAQRLVEQRGAYTTWTNVQTIRNLGVYRAFLEVAGGLCDLPRVALGDRVKPARSLIMAESIKNTIRQQSARESVELESVKVLVPQLQQLLALLSEETQSPVFVFLDDVHYLPRDEVPIFLDKLHGATRDTRVWLKVAGIKHQMRWFVTNPPVGLQTGHDALTINLDVTLQDPKRAKSFLQDVLSGYLDECDAKPRRGFLSVTALDRLVLASGGVPRDFSTLCAGALKSALQRSKARAAGVQDVNEAAGLAAKDKLQELEEDAAAALGSARAILRALNVVREYLLSEKQITFCLVDFLDKEQHPEEYALTQSLMDLRMLHLVHASLSDRDHAGKRHEVYLLDLSQYTGARLKQKLRVLDIDKNHLVLKRTRSRDPVQVGDTPRKVITLFRKGPRLELTRLSVCLESEDTQQGAAADSPPARS